MNRLTILQTCTEDQHQWSQETSQKAAWLDHRLKVGDLIDMGAEAPTEKRWRVVQVDTYQPIDLNRNVVAVDFVQVCLDAQPVPDRQRWISTYGENEYPYVVFAEFGKPELEIGLAIDDYAMSGHRNDLYKPDSKKAAYPRLFVSWVAQAASVAA